MRLICKEFLEKASFFWFFFSPVTSGSGLSISSYTREHEQAATLKMLTISPIKAAPCSLVHDYEQNEQWQGLRNRWGYCVAAVKFLSGGYYLIIMPTMGVRVADPKNGTLISISNKPAVSNY